MNFSEILNILFGTGLVGLVVTVVTMKATVRKANADAEKEKADASPTPRTRLGFWWRTS